NTYTRPDDLDQQKSMYTLSSSLHESTPPSADPRDDRPGAAAQPGAARATAAPARLRGDAGDDLARHQGTRPREARGRRRLSAPGRRGAQPGDGDDAARARRR